MKHFALALLLCIVTSLNAVAQTAADAPATKEDIERYLQVIHSHDMMRQMADAMAKPMHKMMHEQYLKNQDKLPADFEAMMNKQVDQMLGQMPWDDIMDAMVPVYQKHFSKKDVDALVAFYSAPTGQKVLREMPAIMSDAMESMMPILQKHVEKMQENLQQEVAEMIRKSSDTQHPAATKN